MAVLSLCLAILLPGVAQASVTNCTTGQLPATVSDLSAHVPSGLPVGSVIAGSDRMLSVTIKCGANATTTEGTKCSGQPDWDIFFGDGSVPTPSSIPGVFTTSLLPAGIGYRILDGSGQPMLLLSTNRHDTNVRFGGNNSTQDLSFHFQLIKLSTAAVTAGNISFNMQISCNGNEWANKTRANSTILLQGTVKPIIATCAMDVTDLHISLPPVSIADFAKGVGGTAGSASDNLVFHCDAGADARVNFMDASNPGNATDVIGLAASSTAQGVGVRIFSDRLGPFVMSPNSDFGTSGTQLPLTNPNSSGSIGLSTPINVEYVRTGDVSPGSVTAQAIVTISYN